MKLRRWLQLSTLVIITSFVSIASPHVLAEGVITDILSGDPSALEHKGAKAELLSELSGAIDDTGDWLGSISEGADTVVQNLQSSGISKPSAQAANAVALEVLGNSKLLARLEGIGLAGDIIQLISGVFSVAAQYEQHGAPAAAAEAIYLSTKLALELYFTGAGAQLLGTMGAVLGLGPFGLLAGGFTGAMLGNYIGGVLADLLFKPFVEFTVPVFGTKIGELQGVGLQAALADFYSNVPSASITDIKQQIGLSDALVLSDPVLSDPDPPPFEPVSASGVLLTNTFSTNVGGVPSLLAFSAKVIAATAEIMSTAVATGEFTASVTGPGFTSPLFQFPTDTLFQAAGYTVGVGLSSQNKNAFFNVLFRFIDVDPSTPEQEPLPTGNYSVIFNSPINEPSTGGRIFTEIRGQAIINGKLVGYREFEDLIPVNPGCCDPPEPIVAGTIIGEVSLIGGPSAATIEYTGIAPVPAP